MCLEILTFKYIFPAFWLIVLAAQSDCEHEKEHSYRLLEVPQVYMVNYHPQVPTSLPKRGTQALLWLRVESSWC